MDEMASGRGAVRPPMEGKWTFTFHLHKKYKFSGTWALLPFHRCFAKFILKMKLQHSKKAAVR
jgi:hypothetical protein